MTALVRALLSIAAAASAVAAAPLALTPLFDRYRRGALRRIVPAVCGVLHAHGIEYWADFGTLLGFHREHDIILSDKDADLSILRDARPRVLALGAPFARAGLVLVERGGRAGRVLRIRDARTGYHVDLYSYTRDGAMLRSDLASPQEDIPAHLVDRIVVAPFLGGTLRVPADAEALLRRRYGEAFLTPRRGDKGASRPYNVVRSLLEDVEAGWVGLWSWLRSTGS